MDEEDRLFYLREIPELRRKTAPDFWLYWRWRRFGLPYGPWGENPDFLVDRIAAIDSVIRGVDHNG